MFEKVALAIKNPKKKTAALFFSLTLGLPALLCVLCEACVFQKAAVGFFEFATGQLLDYEHWRIFFLDLSWKILMRALAFCAALFFCHFLLKLDDAQEEKKSLALKLVFAAWLLITLCLALLHEPWADEIHAWTMARKLTPAQLWREMAYEGHFLTWYLALAPFARLGLPLASMTLLCWLLNAAAAFLFVKKAKFDFSAKAALLFSEAFLFWQAVVARPYVLIPLLVFLLALVFPERRKRPLLFAVLVALLANTHIYIEAFAAALFLDYALYDGILPWKELSKKERRGFALACAIVVSGAALAFAQVLPAFFAREQNAMGFTQTVSLALKAKAVLGFFCLGNLPPLLFVLFAAVCAALFKADKRSFAIFISSFTFMALFTFFIFYKQLPQRSILWLFPLLYVLWTSPIPQTKKSCALLLLAAALFFPRAAFFDASHDFSCLTRTARAIKKDFPAGSRIYVAKKSFAASVLADEFLDDYDMRRLEDGMPFERFSNKDVFGSGGKLDSFLAERLAAENGRPLILLTSRPIFSNRFACKLLNAFQSHGCEDQVFIYKIEP